MAKAKIMPFPSANKKSTKQKNSNASKGKFVPFELKENLKNDLLNVVKNNPMLSDIDLKIIIDKSLKKMSDTTRKRRFADCLVLLDSVRAEVNLINKREYAKNYYRNNRNKILSYKKEYYQSNKEKISEYKKEYYQSNKEKRDAYQREYNRVKKEKISEQNKNQKANVNKTKTNKVNTNKTNDKNVTTNKTKSNKTKQVKNN